MKGQPLQVRNVKGMQLSLPQQPESASLIENWTVDPITEGLSSRIGYERYRPNITSGFAPFASLGRIDSLFVAQQLPGGARQHILLESNGALYLYYESGQNASLVQLAARTIPTATESPSSYTQVGDRIVVVNGHDYPVVINPWPLPKVSEVAAVSSQVIRPLGWPGAPPQPEALQVATLNADSSPTSADRYTGNSTSNWYPNPGGAISFPGIFGMGNPNGSDAEVNNDYYFKVSFISDTGSESPVSQPVLAQWTIENGTYGFRYAPTIRIPLGPKGTRARRIYATSDSGGLDFFFVADVRNNVEQLFHGFRRTNALGFPAPDAAASSIFPAPRARVCAAFKDCLFLDGGANESDTLFFSKPGFIDQFGVADYIRLPSDGGAVIGLLSYYNNLIVAREGGIDVVTGSYPDFSAQTVTREISCRAPQSMAAVPGVGVMLLAQDGVYALQGGLDGGSVFQLSNIGQPIQDQISRLTLECAPRAVATYSPMDRSYQLYIPVDGNDRPNLGLLFHVEKQGWSVRTGFPVGCIAKTFGGTVIFGHHTGAEAGGSNPPAGLFVLSGQRALGGTIQGDVFVNAAPPVSRYRSAWHDFGDAQIKKQVQYVTLWLMSTGTVSIKMSYYKDFSGNKAEGEEVTYLAQPPDQEELPVYGTAVIGTDVWSDVRLMPLRLPVAVQSCSWFQFELTTSDDVTLVGYELEYVSRGTNIIAGRTS